MSVPVNHFDLNNTPENMYFSHKISGVNDGKDHKRIIFNKQVLRFTEAYKEKRIKIEKTKGYIWK